MKVKIKKNQETGRPIRKNRRKVVFSLEITDRKPNFRHTSPAKY